MFMLAGNVEAMSMFNPVGMFSVYVSTYVICVCVCVCLHVLFHLCICIEDCGEEGFFF